MSQRINSGDFLLRQYRNEKYNEKVKALKEEDKQNTAIRKAVSDSLSQLRDNLKEDITKITALYTNTVDESTIHTIVDQKLSDDILTDRITEIVNNIISEKLSSVEKQESITISDVESLIDKKLETNTNSENNIGDFNTEYNIFINNKKIELLESKLNEISETINTLKTDLDGTKTKIDSTKLEIINDQLKNQFEYEYNLFIKTLSLEDHINNIEKLVKTYE